MKSRTKEQQKLEKWSNHFPALTERQKQFAIKHCFETDDFVVGVRGWFYRPKTNKVWKGESMKMVSNAEKVCSFLHTDNKELEVIHRSNKTDRAYFLLITTKGGYQVGRWFLVTRLLHVDWKPIVKHTLQYRFDAVGVEWMNAEGKLWSYERARVFPGYYIDQWSVLNDMELRRYDLFVSKIDANAILWQNVLPVVRRNGYKRGVSANRYGFLTLRALLACSQYECYYKCGHYAVCDNILHDYYYSFEFHTFDAHVDNELWRTIIKLANRKHVHFDTNEKWRDMLDYAHQLVELGMDIHNPSILFPDDFQKAHAEVQRKIDKKRTQDEREQLAFRHLQQAKGKAKDADIQVWMSKYAEMFKSMDIKSGELEVKALIKFNDFKKEADWMHHCIVTYYGKPHTLLLSITYKGVKTETAEVSLKKNGELIQCRGKYNQPSKQHDEIVALLKKSMKEFIKRYKDFYKNKKKNKQKQVVALPVPASFYNKAA